MWTRVRAFLFLATLTFTAAASAAGTPISGFQETVFQGGLSGPTAIAFLPDGRMLITEQGGALKLSDGTSVSRLITISVCSAIEMGLLGVAVDPNFASNWSRVLRPATATTTAVACGSARTASSTSAWATPDGATTRGGQAPRPIPTRRT